MPMSRITENGQAEDAIGWTINGIARRAGLKGLNALQDVRTYAAEQNLTDPEASTGMEQKAREFRGRGSELYPNVQRQSLFRMRVCATSEVAREVVA